MYKIYEEQFLNCIKYLEPKYKKIILPTMYANNMMLARAPGVIFDTPFDLLERRNDLLQTINLQHR